MKQFFRNLTDLFFGSVFILSAVCNVIMLQEHNQWKYVIQFIISLMFGIACIKDFCKNS